MPGHICQVRAPSGRVFEVFSVLELLAVLRFAAATSEFSPSWEALDLPGAAPGGVGGLEPLKFGKRPRRSAVKQSASPDVLKKCRSASCQIAVHSLDGWCEECRPIRAKPARVGG
jgi:hypothetical protein